jgi:hypothetical protein
MLPEINARPADFKGSVDTAKAAQHSRLQKITYCAASSDNMMPSRHTPVLAVNVAEQGASGAVQTFAHRRPIRRCDLTI